MSELSIFIDESGDFGPVQNHNDYYLVSFVIHEQDNDISEEVKKLEKGVHDAGFNIEYIHTEPVIRREGIKTVRRKCRRFWRHLEKVASHLSAVKKNGVNNDVKWVFYQISGVLGGDCHLTGASFRLSRTRCVSGTQPEFHLDRAVKREGT